MNLWVIGAGEMAREYALVLKHLGIAFTVIGRGEYSANIFRNDHQVEVFSGGVLKALQRLPAPDAAIVATSIDTLCSVTIALIQAGVEKVLVEKPGGINTQQIAQVASAASDHGAEVFVGYNRRFYGSVKLAKKYITEDGGVLSGRFEFTEWSHIVADLEKPPGVKEHWLLGNSSHVIDLAFHLMGRPYKWSSWLSGKIDWHSSAARFVGCGVTVENILFSYFADWEGPGRWELELVTTKRRLIFRPLEEMRVIEIGSTNEVLINGSNALDRDFKPGLYSQVAEFISQDTKTLCRIDEQLANSLIYSKMAGYDEAA